MSLRKKAWHARRVNCPSIDTPIVSIANDSSRIDTPIVSVRRFLAIQLTRLSGTFLDLPSGVLLNPALLVTPGNASGHQPMAQAVRIACGFNACCSRVGHAYVTRDRNPAQTQPVNALTVTSPLAFGDFPNASRLLLEGLAIPREPSRTFASEAPSKALGRPFRNPFGMVPCSAVLALC